MPQLVHQKALTLLRQARLDEFRIEFAKIKKQRGIVDTGDPSAYAKAFYQANIVLKHRYPDEFEQCVQIAIEGGFRTSSHEQRKPRIKVVRIRTREDIDMDKLHKAVARVFKDFELRQN